MHIYIFQSLEKKRKKKKVTAPSIASSANNASFKERIIFKNIHICNFNNIVTIFTQGSKLPQLPWQNKWRVYWVNVVASTLRMSITGNMHDCTWEGIYLKSTDGCALEPQVSFEILCDFSDQALKRQLANKQLCWLLVTTNLSQSDSPRPSKKENKIKIEWMKLVS